MVTQIVVSQTLLVTAQLEVNDEQLLEWLRTEKNILKYLSPNPKDLKFSVKLKSLDELVERDELNIHSIEKSDGTKWVWDGQQLTQLEIDSEF